MAFRRNREAAARTGRRPASAGAFRSPNAVYSTTGAAFGSPFLFGQCRPKPPVGQGWGPPGVRSSVGSQERMTRSRWCSDCSAEVWRALIDSMVLLGAIKTPGGSRGHSARAATARSPETEWQFLRKHGRPVDRRQHPFVTLVGEGVATGVAEPMRPSDRHRAARRLAAAGGRTVGADDRSPAGVMMTGAP
jgi:hypothetical protein